MGHLQSSKTAFGLNSPMTLHLGMRYAELSDIEAYRDDIFVPGRGCAGHEGQKPEVQARLGTISISPLPTDVLVPYAVSYVMV